MASPCPLDCPALLNHTRGKCYPAANSSPPLPKFECDCDAGFGFAGTPGDCSAWSGVAYLHVVLFGVINTTFLTAVAGFGIWVGLPRRCCRGAASLDVKRGTYVRTVVWVWVGFFMLAVSIFNFCEWLPLASMSTSPYNDISNYVLAGATLFGVWSCSLLSLSWVTVAANARDLRRGTTRGGMVLARVTAGAFACCAAIDHLIFTAILHEPDIGTGIAMGIFLALIGVNTWGSCALGKILVVGHRGGVESGPTVATLGLGRLHLTGKIGFHLLVVLRSARCIVIWLGLQVVGAVIFITATSMTDDRPTAGAIRAIGLFVLVHAAGQLALAQFLYLYRAATIRSSLQITSKSSGQGGSWTGNDQKRVDDDNVDDNRATSSSSSSSSPSARRQAYEMAVSPSTRAMLTQSPRWRASSFKLESSMSGEETMSAILSKQMAPMLVVDLVRFLACGHIPRSSERLTRSHRDDDIVVFISHRWWNAKHPDDGEHTKYRLLCRGLASLCRRERLDPSTVAVWVDFACIEQDNVALLQKGVSSLIAYAARSTYLLIPVQPVDEAMRAYSTATSPTELRNYGERAWCRLEYFVFLCLKEVTGRSLGCFAYGAQYSQAASSASQKKSCCRCRCRWQRGGKARFPHHDGEPPAVAAAHRNTSTSKKEVLRQLGTDKSLTGAFFASNHLPSTGDLTVEEDRSKILDIENEIHQVYVVHAVKSEALRLGYIASSGGAGSFLRTRTHGEEKKAGASPQQGDRRRRSSLASSTRSHHHGATLSLSSSRASSRIADDDGNFSLDGKQLVDGDLAYLIRTLHGVLARTNASNFASLSLRDNSISRNGLLELLRDFVAGSGLVSLDVGGNPLGPQGGETLALVSRYLTLAGEDDQLELEDLILDGCGLGDQGALAVAAWLGGEAPTVAPYLREINLKGNGLTDTGVRALVGAMNSAEESRIVIRIDPDEVEDAKLRVEWEHACQRNTVRGLL